VREADRDGFNPPEGAPKSVATEVGETEGDEEEDSSYTSDPPPAAPATAAPVVRPLTRSTASDRTATDQSNGTSSSDYYKSSAGDSVRRPAFSESGPPAGASEI
jgi:hypothetical protein